MCVHSCQKRQNRHLKLRPGVHFSVCCVSFLLLLVLGAFATRGQPEDWSAIEDEYFVIKYFEGYRSDAKAMREYCRFARNVVMDAYPHNLSSKVVVFLYAQPNEYADYGTCSSRVGQTEASLHFITPTVGKEHGVDDLWYRGNVIHEYAHVPFWMDVYRSGREDPPSWLSQGIAEYMKLFRSNISGILQKYEWNLGRAADKVRSGDGYLWLISGDAYYGGAYIVKYMYETYGTDRVVRLIRSDTRSFKQALEEELEVTAREFEENWLRWACEEFDVDPDTYMGFESYEQLLSEYNALSTVRNANHVLIITTILLTAATLYFAKKKPRRDPYSR